MISFVRGIVTDVTLTTVTLDVSGVGYLLYAPKSTLIDLHDGETLTCFTHFVVREDAHDLYGFLSKEERAFFLLILSVSGIGPKSALQILDKAPTSRLRTAISQNDIPFLNKVAGIGLKTAQKLVLELRDKIGATEDVHTHDGDALEALTSLGYSLDESRDALQNVSSDIIKIGDRVKAALKLLGRK
jgi:holliday junction DNA helicase RuvA